ncbi:transporter substrate-binding domain-containing protein [Nisaea sp.]|uniref:transporter substrate-binding domain-containing protein n=1 Tax=Nisaea sp. TaxID=2024842 RepID=UPI003296DC81
MRQKAGIFFFVKSAVSMALAMASLVAILSGAMADTVEPNRLGLSPEERAWIVKNPTLSVAFDPFYAPYSSLGNRGEYTGLAPEIFTKIAELTGLRFTAAPIHDWQSLMDKARARKVDVVATIVDTEPRRQFLSFTEPYLPTPLVMMARIGDYGILGPKSLAGKTVALVRGYSTTDKILSEHPDIIPHFVASPLEALKDVSVGQADAYVGVVGVNTYLTRHHGLANLRISSEYEFNNVAQSIGVRPDFPLLTSIIQKALKAIGPIEQTEAYQKWVPILKAVVDERSNSPFELTEVEQDWLDRTGPIRIGINASWAPMDFVDADGKPRGIGAGFLRAMDRRLDGIIEIVPGPWPEIYAAAKAGDLDGIADISPTPARQEIFAFTEPYIEVPHVIFALADAPLLTSLNSLRGKHVGVEKGFFLGDLIEKRFSSSTVSRFATTGDALTAVSKGEIDAYVGNRAVSKYAIHTLLINNLKEHGTVEETSSINAFGFHKSNIVLRDIVQKALDNITVREKRSIFGAWVPQGRDQKPFTLTPEERDWLARHQTIRVAGDRSYAPVEFIGSNGTFQGLSPDFLAKLSELLGISFVYDTKSSWNDALSRFESRDLDIASAVATTATRRQFAEFTEPYLRLPLMIFGRRGGFFAGDLDDLTGRPVAVVKGYAATEYLLTEYPDLSFVSVDTVEKGTELLLAGHVDAYIGSILTTSHAIREDGFNALMVTGKTPFTVNLSIAVRKDWPVFAKIMRRAVNHLSATERTEVINKWIGLRIKEPTDYRFRLQLSLIAMLIAALAAAWIWHLWRRTHFQAKKLEEQNETLANESRSRLEAQQNAERANMEKDHLLANVSHELRTPLNAVVGYTELLESKIEVKLSRDKVVEYLDAIKTASGQLHAIVRDLLELTDSNSPIALSDEPVPLEELISTVRCLLPEQTNIVWPAPLSLAITADVHKLSQVLVNLLNNAIKFSPPESEITLSARRLNSGDLELIVKDAGIGIDPAIIDDVTLPFVRGDDPFIRDSQGSGLGLSISKTFVEAHGGDITLESTLGKGTAAIVRLPESRIVEIAA